MSNYNRNVRPGGGRYQGGDYRRRDSGRREMHKAVCDECGNNCEVPFRPSGDKPIYCSSCFEGKGGGNQDRPDRKRSQDHDYQKQDKTSRQLVDQVTSLNKKLDRILFVLESGKKKKEKVEKTKVKKKDEKKVIKKESKKGKKVVKKEDIKKKSTKKKASN